MNAKSQSTSYRHSHQKKGREYHDKFQSNSYRRLAWRWERCVLDQVVAELPPENRESLLDLACGTGRIIGHLNQHFSRSVGIDISANMLKVAAAEVPGVRLVHGDVTDPLVLEQDRFDVITAFRFFANAEPALRGAVIDKISSLLRPGGILVANNHKNCRSLQYRLSRAKSALLHREAEGEQCLATEELVSRLRLRGLVLTAIRSWGILPGNESRIFLPERLQYAFESALSKYGAGKNLALYHLCIFRKCG